MPKKFRNPSLLVKPVAASTTYSSKNTSNRHPADTPPATSVNDLIQRSRQTQQRVKNRDVQHQPTPNLNQGSVHPSLQGLLVDATGPLALDTRARRRLPGTPLGTPARRTGPPPPPSWVLHSANQNGTREKSAAIGGSEPGGIPKTMVRPPGIQMPEPGSLLDITLRMISDQWQAVFDYEQHYICDLSSSTKTLLLLYIAERSPSPMDLHGLQLLFASPSVEDEDQDGHTDRSWEESEETLVDPSSTTAITAPKSLFPTPQIDEDVTHLPLPRSITQNISLNGLKSFLLLPITIDDAPSSWDSLPPPSPHRFPNLTYLSLSYPSTTNPFKLWNELPNFLHSVVPTITHLSLAGWPDPPDVTAVKRLCRATLCLKWLDLSDAGEGSGVEFVEMLAAADWKGSWRGIRTVVINKILKGDACTEQLKRRIWEGQPGVGRKAEIIFGKADCEDDL